MMKISNLWALAALFVGSAVAQERTGQEYNGATCEEAAKKEEAAKRNGQEFVGFTKSSSEFMYNPNPTNVVDLANVNCLPADVDVSNAYGAWYKLEIPGSSGMQLNVDFYSSNGPDVPHAVSVMEGECSALTCVKFAGGGASAGTKDPVASFPLLTNTAYNLYISVANATGVFVPGVIGIRPTDPESACKYYRSQQINFGDYNGGGLGTCTPCQSSTTAEGTTVWTTTCSDACQRCYDVTEGQPSFCYTESRNWVGQVDANTGTPTSHVRNCYNFADGTSACDEGYRTGACALEINGAACSACANDPSGCGTNSTTPYAIFQATCADGAIDKCTNTGFEASPALTNYGIYTDVILANVYGMSPAVPEYQGACQTYVEEGLPVATPAPTPVPDPAIPLGIDEEFGPFDVALTQNKVFVVNVEGVSGILSCETDADDGDLDLYIGKGYVPITQNVDCLSEGFTSEEVCNVIVDGIAGTGTDSEVYVLVTGFAATTGATVECKLTTLDDARTYDTSAVGETEDFDLDFNEYRLYELDVPQDSVRISCETRADEGDLDLWMRVNHMPVPYEYSDCVSNGHHSNEYCELTGDVITGQPKIYILVQGWKKVEGGEFTCETALEYGKQDIGNLEERELDLGDSASRFDLLINENRLFYVDVPRGTRRVWCDVSGDGDSDLYMRVGDRPTLPGNTLEGGVFDCASRSDGGTEDCFYEWSEQSGAPDRTKVYALVTGFDTSSSVRIQCDADTPLTEDDAEELDFGGGSGDFVVFGNRDFFGVVGNECCWDLEKDQELLLLYRTDEFTKKFHCETDSRNGDIDMYWREGSVPERGGHDNFCSSAGGGSRESCEKTWGGAGSFEEDIYILITAFEDTDDIEITCGIEFDESLIPQNIERKGGDPDLP